MPAVAAETAEATTSATQLTEKELRQLQEVQVKINLKGLFKAWDWVTKKKPFEIYQTVTRKVEGKSKKLMVGNASALGMPIGIVLRNTSRAGHNLSTGRYGHLAQVVGGAAVLGGILGGIIAGGPVIAGALGLSGIASAVGYIAGGIAGTLLWKPVYTAATLAASTVGAAASAVFSTLISAPANLLVGLRRSKASLKGIKLTEEQLAAQQEAFDRRSPSAQYAREQEDNVRVGLSRISKAKKEQIYLDLKAEFEPAAAVQGAPAGQPAAKPATAPKGPTV
jgi:hypothetical protein